MFIILVTPISAGGAVSLFYKSKETAEIAHKNIHEFQKGVIEAPVLVAKDDFGHVLTISRLNIAYAVFIDHLQAAQLGPPQGQRPSGIPGVRNAPPAPDTELTASEAAA